MKIRMIVSLVGTDYARAPGDVVDVEKDEAVRLIEAGYAEAFRDEPVVETAAKKPRAEKAGR